jgi:hypothetical protein
MLTIFHHFMLFMCTILYCCHLFPYWILTLLMSYKYFDNKKLIESSKQCWWFVVYFSTFLHLLKWIHKFFWPYLCPSTLSLKQLTIISPDANYSRNANFIWVRRFFTHVCGVGPFLLIRKIIHPNTRHTNPRASSKTTQREVLLHISNKRKSHTTHNDLVKQHFHCIGSHWLNKPFILIILYIVPSPLL